MKIKKIPLVILPLSALTITPIIFVIYNSKKIDNQKTNIKNNWQINSIINNNNLSIKDKIQQLIKEMDKFQDNIKKVLEIIQDLTFLNDQEQKIMEINLKTNKKNVLVKKFQDSLQKNITLEDLGVNSEQIKIINSLVTINYKLIEINHNEGQIIIEIDLKYKNYSTKIKKDINGFMKNNQSINNIYKQIEGFFDFLENQPYFEINKEIATDDKVEDLLKKIINDNFDATTLISLKSNKDNQLIKNVINQQNIISLDVKITNLQNQESKEFKDIKFKIKK